MSRPMSGASSRRGRPASKGKQAPQGEDLLNFVPLPYTVNESTRTEQFFREKKDKQYKMRDMVRKYIKIIIQEAKLTRDRQRQEAELAKAN